jgi:pilus assembly protein CpaE
MDLPSFVHEISPAEVEQVVRSTVKVVFLDLGKDPPGLEGVEALSHQAPDLALIVAGPELSAEGLLSVMRAGAAEYLPRPFSDKDVDEAFLRAKRRAKLEEAEEASVPGRVATVFSAKGGTGVTIVATNLAVALRRLTHQEVLLIDFAPSMGTAALVMGIDPRYTHLDLIQNYHRLDKDLFHSFLEVHESGVHVLASPSQPGEAASPSAEEFQGLMRLGREFFDFVVVDGGTLITEELVALLRESDERLMVVTPEVPTLRNLKRAVDLLRKLDGYDSFRLVLNQFRDGVGLTPRDVEEGLGQPVSHTLEKDDLGILESVNVGRPEALTGRSRLGKAFMALARDLAGPDFEPSASKGLLGKLFGGRNGGDKKGKERK